jgi:2-keto-4-pentenoate hydratase
VLTRARHWYVSGLAGRGPDGRGVMDADQISALARAFWTARKTGRPLGPMDHASRPETVADGYAVSLATDAIARADGWAGGRIGWKVAGTTPRVRAAAGFHEPLLGPLYANFQLQSGSGLPRAEFAGVVEAEFAIVVGDLTTTSGPYGRAEILAVVESVHPALELPGSRLADLTQASMPDIVADGAAANTFVLGPAAPVEPAALRTTAVTLTRSGEEGVTGSGADILDDPILAVAWLANRLVDLGLTLHRGDVVLTGAAALVRDVASGETLSADFGELGTVSVIVA